MITKDMVIVGTKVFKIRNMKPPVPKTVRRVCECCNKVKDMSPKHVYCSACAHTGNF